MILEGFRDGSHVKPVIDKIQGVTGLDRREISKRITAAVTLGLVRKITAQTYQTVKEEARESTIED